MNEKVRVFLDARKELEKKKYEEEKENTLVKLGLYEKEYSPDNALSNEFPLCEWEQIDSTSAPKYYKRVFEEITDEEYQEIKKYVSKDDDVETSYVANALKIIAWLTYIGGFIAGIILGTVEVEIGGLYYSYMDTEFSFAMAFTYWCISFISGTVFLGFAEIIKLLDEIKNK